MMTVVLSWSRARGLGAGGHFEQVSPPERLFVSPRAQQQLVAVILEALTIHDAGVSQLEKALLEVEAILCSATPNGCCLELPSVRTALVREG